ncbi:hypothetical protein MT391_07620 [Vibrio sp. 1-Bac 57]
MSFKYGVKWLYSQIQSVILVIDLKRIVILQWFVLGMVAAFQADNAGSIPAARSNIFYRK